MIKDNYAVNQPCKKLETLVDSFWMHHNPLKVDQVTTIAASSFLNLVIYVHNEKIIYYVLTGLWTEPKEIHLPPRTTIYGCRMKILAPEFLLQREVSTICNKLESLDLSYLNINNWKLTNFKEITKQWELELLKIKSTKIIPEHKLKLSELLYNKTVDISPAMISDQINWSNRQINRYLNKQIGVPLKKYLNILKCHDAFFDIIQGEFYPSKNYFDQSHFIREVKKYTGETPKKVFESKNDRFIQLRNLTSK